MRQIIQAAVLAAAVVAVPAMAMAGQSTAAPITPGQATAAPAKASHAKTVKTQAATLHSARGVVKSIDGSSLVLTEAAGKKAGHEVHFVLDPATAKEGNVAVGSSVQVKYHNAGKQHMATDVRVAGKKS